MCLLMLNGIFGYSLSEERLPAAGLSRTPESAARSLDPSQKT
jgi:hypothetical protein